MMTTSIVILNWNGKGFLERFLPSVIRSVSGIDGVDIVVADNGSTDGSDILTAEMFPGVRFLPLGKNHGFAEGYNRALKQLESDCFLLLNSDVEVPEDWFPPLAEWMELHPECGVCGPKLHMIGERDRFEYAGAAGGYIDRLGYPFCRGRMMKMTEKDEGQYDVPAEVMWVSGAALMVRSSVWFSLGGLCGDFFAHMEEIDFCWRARLEGWKVNVVPRSVVYHIGGGSLPQESPYKLFLNYRNNLLMLSRCLPETFALGLTFNVLGKVVDRDEGPDIFGLCTDAFNEGDRKFRKDLSETAAMAGAALTASCIRRRMFMDTLSGIVYLFRGKTDCFKAVTDAHREYRKMKKDCDVKKLRHVIEDILTGDRLDIARNMLTDSPGSGNLHNGMFGIRAVWSKWIVWQSAFRKYGVFKDIKENLI